MDCIHQTLRAKPLHQEITDTYEHKIDRHSKLFSIIACKAIKERAIIQKQ